MGTRIAFVLAVVLGIVSALGVRMWMTEYKRENIQKYQPREILVAAKRIRKGDQVKPDMMKSALVEQPYISQGMIPYDDRMRFINKISDRDISPGRPIWEDFLSESNPAVTQTRQIVSEGKRAVVLDVDQVSGVAGMLKPGDYVDVVGTFEIAGETDPNAPIRSGNKKARTLYLLQAVRVIALDNRTLGEELRSNSRSLYRTVTLEVAPDDVMRLINAQRQGKIQLILRNRTDVAVTPGLDEQNNRPTVFWDILNEVKQTQPRQ